MATLQLAAARVKMTPFFDTIQNLFNKHDM